LIRLGIKENQGGVWRHEPVEKFDMTPRVAKVALHEAWRLMDPKGSNMCPFRLKVTYKVKDSTVSSLETLPRNLTAWMNWDRWTKQGLTMKQRAEELGGLGYDVTSKALARAAEEYGL